MWVCVLWKPTAKREGLPASQGSPTRALTSSKRFYAFDADEHTWAFTDSSRDGGAIKPLVVVVVFVFVELAPQPE
jgi:hypothetical protein